MFWLILHTAWQFSLFTYDKNIILAGLDGVGKSTLANLICQDEGNFILADNIVLFDGKNALNLNLTMRLEKEVETNLKIIYQNSFIKEVVPVIS